jgi:N-acyl-D-amino-acid deacylase
MKKELHEVFSKYLNRRDFLGSASTALLALGALPLIGSQARAATPTGPAITSSGSGPRMLLTNGFIVDGTGKKGYTGSVLISGDTIVDVAPGTVSANGAAVIDCAGKVIAPGFIDAHSHMDWYLPAAGREELKTPFTAQGITTFVAGNCGYGLAGYRKGADRDSLVYLGGTRDYFTIAWDTMEGYFAHLRKVGMTHNLVNLVGHGTTRASMRGFDPSPLSGAEMSEMLGLLGEAMDQGAWGVSFGLQYEPGLFSTTDEIEQVCRLVKEKGKVVTVHSKAYSTLSGTYPIKPLGAPHNLIALKEMLDIARKTGVKLQLSHLIFVGSLTWKNADTALAMIDRAIADGLDVKFDTYSYHCGASHINVFLPPWFLAKAPEVYEDEAALRSIRLQFMFIEKVMGFGMDDIQITYAGVDDLNQYNGMFLSEIAEARGMDRYDNFFDMAKRSKGRSLVLNHRYSNPEIIETLMKHPASLFMTDAWVEEAGVQNPSAFGCFPRFLEWARDKELITLEEAVRKMTGATAERFGITDRGFLKKGLAADVTVFDCNTVKDNNTVSETGNAPTGIEMVFINGARVVRDGKVDPTVKAGVVVG